MNKFLLLVLCLLAVSCAYQEPYIIAQPPGPDYVVVQPAQPNVAQSMPPVVVPPSGQRIPIVSAPQVEVWRPDPTQGLICNQSRTITLDRLWIDSRPPAPSTVNGLGPELCQPVHVFLGDHFWYAEGSIELPAYGKVSVGTMRREFSVRNWSYWGGGYAWRLYINDGDFGR
jgi:hypothetical protein